MARTTSAAGRRTIAPRQRRPGSLAGARALWVFSFPGRQALRGRLPARTTTGQRVGGPTGHRREPLCSDLWLRMTQDVEHLARRLANKDAQDSPRLVGQRMHDLAPQALSRRMGLIDIIDLD